MMAGVAGLILAGGRSSRMGGTDKTLMPLGGKPMVARVLERLSPQVSTTAINTNGDPALFGQFGVDVLADTLTGYQGPLAGVLTGLEWARTKTGITHLLSVAGDTPFFPDDLAERLCESASGSTVAVAASHGRTHPTFALWPVSLCAALTDFLQNGDVRRVMTFLEQAGMVAVDFPDTRLGGGTIDPFFNINTPDDLAAAERLLAGVE